MTTKELKERIWKYEFYHNGFHRLSGADVKVVNVKKRKDRILADVILYNGEHEERYDNCEYPLEIFKKKKIEITTEDNKEYTKAEHNE